MDGKDSKNFERFEFYCTSAYNVLRRNGLVIIALMAMMVSAEIPQIRSIANLDYMKQQLDLGLSDSQAAEKMIKLIRDTLEN